MRRKGIIISVVALASMLRTGVTAGGSFELLSRTLLQGNITAASFYEEGIIVASGAALAVAYPSESIPEYKLLPLGGEIRDLAVNGKYAYAAARNFGLVTIDLSDPHNPKETDTFAISQPSGLAIASDRLIVLVVRKGLYIFSLSDPAKPELTEKLELDPGAVSIGASNKMIAVFYSEKTILYDIGKDRPAGEPLIIKSPGGQGRGYITGSILFTFHRRGLTKIYDISGSGPPRKTADMPIDDISSISFDGHKGIALTEEGKLIPFTYSKGEVRTAKQLEVDMTQACGIKTAKTDILSILKSRKRSHTVPGGALAVAAGKIASFGPEEGLYLFNIDGDNICPVSHIPNGGFAFDLVADSGWLYVANGSDGIRTGKVGIDGNVEWKGHFKSTVARDIAVSGDLLLLADGGDGLKVIDIKDPADPFQIGSISSPYFLSAVVTRGTLAFLAGGMGGAEIVDFSDPKKPKAVWRKDFSEVRGVFADEEYFYFSDGFEGFHIYKVNGEKTELVSKYNTSGWNDDLFVSGNMIYLAEGGNGLYIADIKDRKTPVMLGSVDIGSIAREIHLWGNTVFIASHKKGITAVDVSDPHKPFIAARHRSADDARGVFADGNFVYLASGAGGVYIFRYIER
ncbi:MAG: hypothetical protein JW746_01700 [Candidatus Krumholzibacteriota bacterium]|nr:hypothetical protein [Candidatus Krumholzibacteriota bacterium]